MEFVWAIAMLITSAVISAVTQPKTQKPKPAAFEDFDYPQIEEGTAQTVIFGEVIIEDQFILWYGNLRTEPIKSSGGKK
jgi:hypothetical protein